MSPRWYSSSSVVYIAAVGEPASFGDEYGDPVEDVRERDHGPLGQRVLYGGRHARAGQCGEGSDS